jgi:hypothetical protein
MSFVPKPKRRGRQPPPYGVRICTLCATRLKLVSLDPPVFKCLGCGHEIRPG